MEAPLGRNGGRLLGAVRRQRTKAEISGRRGHQQLSVLEVADGGRTAALHLRIRGRLVRTEAPTVAAAGGVVARGRHISDISGNPAGCERRQDAPRKLRAWRLAGSGLSAGRGRNGAAAGNLRADVGTRAAGIS